MTIIAYVRTIDYYNYAIDLSVFDSIKHFLLCKRTLKYFVTFTLDINFLATLHVHGRRSHIIIKVRSRTLVK